MPTGTSVRACPTRSTGSPDRCASSRRCSRLATGRAHAAAGGQGGVADGRVLKRAGTNAVGTRRTFGVVPVRLDRRQADATAGAPQALRPGGAAQEAVHPSQTRERRLDAIREGALDAVNAHLASTVNTRQAEAAPRIQDRVRPAVETRYSIAVAAESDDYDEPGYAMPIPDTTTVTPIRSPSPRRPTRRTRWMWTRPESPPRCPSRRFRKGPKPSFLKMRIGTGPRRRHRTSLPPELCSPALLGRGGVTQPGHRTHGDGQVEGIEDREF